MVRNDKLRAQMHMRSELGAISVLKFVLTKDCHVAQLERRIISDQVIDVRPTNSYSFVGAQRCVKKIALIM